jgi:hypothetical protein
MRFWHTLNHPISGCSVLDYSGLFYGHDFTTTKLLTVEKSTYRRQSLSFPILGTLFTAHKICGYLLLLTKYWLIFDKHLFMFKMPEQDLKNLIHEVRGCRRTHLCPLRLRLTEHTRIEDFICTILCVCSGAEESKHHITTLSLRLLLFFSIEV